MTPFDREETPIYDIIDEIFDALERAEREGRSSVRGGERGLDRPFNTGYEFAVDWGLDAVGPPIEDGPESGEVDEHLVDSRQENDEVRVVADLPDVDGDALAVRLTEDHRLLDIEIDEEVIERISLPWPADIEMKRLNNGVLDVGLVRIDGDDDQRSTDE